MDLVGRREELATIRRALVGRSALVLINGGPGYGKTRLINALRGMAGVGAILLGRCHAVAERFPLGPVIDALATSGSVLPPPSALDPLIGAVSWLVPEIAAGLPPAPRQPRDRTARRHHLFRAIRMLLEAIGPVTLVIDDADRIDVETVGLLDFLCARPPEGLCIVLALRSRHDRTAIAAVTARLDDRYHVTHVGLGPLSISDVGELLTQLTRAEVSAAWVEELWLRTGGVPAMVVMMAAALAAGSGLTNTDLRTVRRALDELPSPSRLREWLQAELSPLSTDTIETINAVAVLRAASNDQLIRAMTRLSASQTAAAIAEGVSADLLVDDGAVQVATPLLASAVYEAMAPSRRRLFHRRAAEALARLRPVPFARLADQARLSGDHRNWWLYAEKAADQATTRGDEPEATRLLRAALDAPLSPRTRERLTRKLAGAAINGLSHHDTAAVLQEVLASTDLPVAVRGELRLSLGLMLINQAGKVDAGQREISLAVPDLHDTPALLARALCALVVPRWPRGTMAEHAAWMVQAVEAAARSKDQEVTTAVVVNRVTALLNLGDPAGRRALTELRARGDSLTETAHLARGACSHADAAGWLGHYRLADELIERAETLAAEVSEGFTGTIIAATRLRLDWCCGRWNGLLQRSDSLRIEAADVPPVALEARLVMGLLQLGQGNLTAAAEHLAAAGQVTDPDAAIPVAVTAATALATLLLSRGQHHEAQELVHQAVGLIRRKGNWIWAADMASQAVDVMLACNNIEAAGSFVAELTEGLAGRHTPLGAAALAACSGRALAVAGRTRQAAFAHGRAARAYAKLPQPYAAAQELAAAGRCLTDSDREAGSRLLTLALTRLETLGAAREANRCRMELRERGITIVHRRGRRGYGDDLSPRETEVAQLAAGGLTNREIASALFLSERTVEDHITQALRKTRVTSRHALTTREAVTIPNP